MKGNKFAAAAALSIATLSATSALVGAGAYS
jgi:hypothetical protein